MLLYIYSPYFCIAISYSGDTEALLWVLPSTCDPESCDYKDLRKAATNVDVVFYAGMLDILFFFFVLLTGDGNIYYQNQHILQLGCTYKFNLCWVILNIIGL